MDVGRVGAGPEAGAGPASGVAFASDLDGTLCPQGSWSRFEAADVAAIRELQRAGGLFGVCTGRSAAGVAHALGRGAAGVELDFQIVATGALVLDGAGRELFSCRADPAAVGRVVERYLGRLPLVVQAGDYMCTFGEPSCGQVPIGSVADLGGRVFGVSLAAGSPAGAREVAAWVNAELGEKLVAFENVRNVDVVARGCSKGRAVDVVRRHLGAGLVAAIGDSYNDLPMLEAADVAFAFADSPREVRERADHLVGSVAEAVGALLDARRA
ncbi:MAG: HAD family hydrolase [Olsenella sp.]|jgi:hydroxymethylpyrimidine pyrophosphatase-like HAD family hydrolase